MAQPTVPEYPLTKTDAKGLFTTKNDAGNNLSINRANKVVQNTIKQKEVVVSAKFYGTTTSR